MPSENAFQDLFRFHPVPMWVYDAGTLGFLEVNEAACRVYGYDRETFLTLELRDIRPPEEVPLLEEDTARRRSPFQESGIWRHWTRDHRIMQVEIVSQTLRFGSRDAVLVMARDVSVRQQEEQELESSLIRLAQARDLAHLGLWDLDLLSSGLAWSWEGMDTKLPSSQKRLTCLEDLIDLVPSAERAFVRSGFDRAGREGGGLLLEQRVVLDSGDERILRLVGEVVKDGHGRPVHLEGIAQDVTEQRLAEEETRLSELRLRALVEHAPVAIFVLRQGRILYLNPKAMAMFGLDVMDAQVGRSILDYVSTGLDATLLLSSEESPAAEFESVGLRADGSTFPVSVAVAAFHLPNGPAKAAFLRDLTEARRAEAQQREMQMQLMNAHRLESLGCLAGGVAHDMNNVLGAILSLANVHQLTAPEGTPLRANMDTIAKACLRGRTLVQGLLGFARKNLAEEIRVDLNELAKEQMALLERTTLQRVRLELDLEPHLLQVLGDPSALAHALMNLCVNALDAMPEGGRLTLRTANGDGGGVRLEVEDTGSGMAQDILDRVMEPFFTTKPQGRGTGLGLPMVYGTVKAHRGDMNIRSVPGQGTVVAIQLPSCGPDDGRREAAVHAARASRSLDILVVDDDDLLQASSSQILAALGHRAVLAASGEAALALLDAGLKVDGVILDLNMPGLGGAGTLPRIRALRPGLPVILATGRADQRALDLSASVPFVTLMAKPYSLEDLQQRLEALG